MADNSSLIKLHQVAHRSYIANASAYAEARDRAEDRVSRGNFEALRQEATRNASTAGTCWLVWALSHSTPGNCQNDAG